MTSADRVSQVAQQLEDDILSGKLAPGELLPSERELSARLGVSRSVVREALGRLTSLGLVRSLHGSGTRVEPPDSKQVRVGYQRLLSRPEYRLEQLAAVRLALETAIASAAAVHRSADQLDRLRQTLTTMGEPNRPLEDHVTADLEFHAILADATGNPLFQVVLAPIQELLIQSLYRTLGRYGASVAHAHHALILEAVADQNPAAAARAMQHHIQTNLQHLDSLQSQTDAGHTVS
jgi:DNA-binding FadR family transcriptional regulator